MAHHTGNLECGYCRHFRAEDQGAAALGVLGWCGFHESELKASAEHRFCCQLVPNDRYDQDHPRRCLEGRFVQLTVAEQLNRLGGPWEAGVVYGFDPSTDQPPQPWATPVQSNTVSAPSDDRRHRIEAALLNEDASSALVRVMDQLVQEEVDLEDLCAMLEEYAQMLSGNAHQAAALRGAVSRLKSQRADA